MEIRLLNDALEWIKKTDFLIVSAGAGLGVDSGLPDFRGPTGLWQSYPGLKSQGLRFEQIANPSAFERDPHLAWGFYGHRLKLYRETIPNRAYAFFLRRLNLTTLGGLVFTSNVDGQFQKAGFPPEVVYEVHGSIHHLQCFTPCTNKIWSADGFEPVVDATTSRLQGPFPTCPQCQGLARPNILMFGDWNYIEDDSNCSLEQRISLARQAQFPIVVEIGAGVSVPTVRYFSEKLGFPLIRINPSDFSIPTRQRGKGIELAMNAVAATDYFTEAGL